jgi:hypothetical protein
MISNTMKKRTLQITSLLSVFASTAVIAQSHISYPVVDTGQIRTYDEEGEILYPKSGDVFYGQDAQFEGIQFSFKDNGDGTVTDNNTGLMWQQVPSPDGFSWEEAIEYCNELELGGHDDWRIPTLKELFAISDFSKGWPYLDTNYFSLATDHLGKDEQFWCAEDYKVGTTHGNMKSAFGVNHATGHIKAYPAGKGPNGGKHVRAVRGDVYGVNQFVDNQDGTITDEATGLMWMQSDTGTAMEWEDALAYAENATTGGYVDWRLPNVKELQSIVDYSGRLPAIDPLFDCTPITNEAGEPDFGYYWTSTSAQFSSSKPGYYYAWYVAFGRAVDASGHDSHGAGAVRFDSKTRMGPQGEGGERYVNYVRLVRGGTAVARSSGPAIEEVVAVDLPEQDAPQGGAPMGQQPNMGGPQDASAAAFIARLDKDGDGKVSQAEFDGPDEHFNQADQDQDGYLIESEAPSGPPQNGPQGGPPPGAKR